MFSDKYIWLISGANFFVYTIRLAVLDWASDGSEGISLGHASLIVAGFEFAGLGGMLASGWLTDKVCKGRANPVSLVWMLLVQGSTFLLASRRRNISGSTRAAHGDRIFHGGPQRWRAVAVANLATKKAAATAVGLTSIFGYASTVLSGWGLGLLVQHYGWNRAFPLLIGIALLGAVLFAAALPAKAHGYGEEE